MSGPWDLGGREPSGQQRPGQAPSSPEQQGCGPGHGQHPHLQMAPMPGEPRLAPRRLPRAAGILRTVAAVVLTDVGAAGSWFSRTRS